MAQHQRICSVLSEQLEMGLSSVHITRELLSLVVGIQRYSLSRIIEVSIMTDGNNTGVAKLTVDEAGEVVRALGTIFSNSFLYGPEHGVTKKAVEDAFAILQVVFGRGQEVSFNLSDDELIVNGMTLELKNPLMRMLATHLADMEISSFTINHELTKDDFLKLVDLLNQKPTDLVAAGGFPAGVKERGIGGVATKSIVYKAVTEDEVVVSKDALDAAAQGLGEGAQANIIAFLKGDASADEAAVAEGLAAAADDAQKLSELILKAAEVRQQKVDLDDGEDFSSIVVGCLRKAYDVLSQDKSAKTQKGKKNLQKMLMLLEKELLDKLKAVADGADIDDAFITDAIEEMEDELKIDSLASDYMKKRSAIETNENRILRFIRAKGLDKIENTDLKDRLFEGGLDIEGWRELVDKSGISKGAGFGSGSGGGMEAMGHLAVLLHEMESSISSVGSGQGKAGVEGLDKVAEGVHKEIQGLVAKTEKKILGLVENMQKENEAEIKGEPVPEGKRMPRKKLMEILAEIAQELCQPLAVINCSVDMIRGGCLGEVAPTQVEMLCLAAESGAKLQTLIDKLMKISGVPETRSPDASIQESLYR